MQTQRGHRRRLLVLQGPVGRFFGAMTRRATASGHEVTKVHFNFADQVFHGGGTEVRFTQPMDSFRTWLLDHCRQTRPDAILLFGDRRPPHIDACAVAEELGLRIYAFEEGYLRPNFITFERHGNNARSLLPRDPNEIHAFKPVTRDIVPMKSTFVAMTRDAIAYYVVLAAGQFRYPSYRHHRARPLVIESSYWLRNTWRRVRATLPDSRLQASLIAQQARRYFVVALQVHDDLQSIHHGRGWTQERLIETSVASFAAHAPADTRLVFRCHPYDRGHTSHDTAIKATAAKYGVAERVHFLQTGHGPSLLASARGFVTVNSTMALGAMYHLCPVFAFGDTFYRVPGLVAPALDEAGLAQFWNDPGMVDEALYEAFLNMLRAKALVNGSFYHAEHWDMLIDEVLARIEADCLTVTATV